MSNIKTDQIVAGGSYKPKYSLPSGSYQLDELLTRRGFPSGSMIHLYSSQEGAFKTAFALMGAINMQARGEKVGFVDAEKSLDTAWGENFGLKTDKDSWVYSMPTNGEIALQHVETMITEHDCKVVILDSIDACQPSKYIEGEYGESVMMVHAKLINKFARRITGLCKDHDAIVYVINQMRTAGGGNMTYNKPSGGKGLPFYSTINIEMKRDGSPSSFVGEIDIPLVMRIRRSKMAASFRDIETFGRQGMAIDADAELVKIATQNALIERAGSWYRTVTEGDEKPTAIGQSLDDAKEWVRENIELVKEQI
jgi:recombination protein RecA